MRSIIWLVLLCVVAVVAATTLGSNDGLVTIYWAGWRTELSLNLFLIVLALVCALLFSAAQAMRSLLSLPERASEWRALRRERAAQAALREAQAEFFSARYTRAHKAALRALALRDDSPQLQGDAEFAVLAQLLAAASLHRLQDRSRRDAVMQSLFQGMRHGGGHGAEDGARLLAAEWAIDDRDALRAAELLDQLPAGVARRTQALRLKLQASRLQRQPLQALHTARLLAKHQGFTPIAARGLLRSLAAEAIEDSHDLHQLQRLWQQLDPADRADASVAARAAARAGRLGSNADAREWLRPFWDRLGELDRDDREAVALALFEAAPGIEHEWLPRLEAALEAHGHDSAVVAAVGMAFADRQLWGKARKLLEQSAAAGTLPLRARRRAWRALAQMAREAGDDARAQDCERAAAALE
ncbi:MAG: heme biosynthesis protein HemY [Proteobacteria bacterium]|nr:heme biosynthesis protein HemY [Pseudomonadota bacterium]